MASSPSTHHKTTSHTSVNGESRVEESLDFSSPRYFSDVVLVVEDTKFHVHKSTLSMWSPVFEAMFSSQFLESSAREIPLPGKHAEEVKELLQVIYSSWSKPIVTEKNYQFLLQLADEYQIDRVKSLCSEFLTKKIQVPNCLEFFKLAEQYGLNDVTEKCHQEVCYITSADLEGSEHLNGFEPEFKVDICMKVIKELERTLQEYVKTCSDLVQKVYQNVSVKINGGLRILTGLFSKNLNDHSKRHKLQRNVHAKVALQKLSTFDDYAEGHPDRPPSEFKLFCHSCAEEVQQAQWKHFSVSGSILKELLNSLYELQVRYYSARPPRQ